ncbi:hypothetical protein [Campylobacter hyointestinalis]|uniref:hypothetical protein n=1 Tax=Campylobacter hyointestinalis TaxID=198 RepID=UPI000CE4979F|nr:hypothetical protein [Campylobacter hyointestinalis]PPB52946.1 hypothetical protein CDQ69_05945 [Campylobacter hyointestinalis subsp. hyointestinalis]PPB63551.1 hypothetical protein CDQ74_04025 [Campylobacter hyointestinalis subsp. hyointestinalis]
MPNKDKYKIVEELFIDLMSCTLENVLEKLKSGSADSKDVRNAITLLKDNGFTLRDIPMNKDPNEVLSEIAKTLPALPNLSKNGEIIDLMEYDENEQ